MALRNLKENLTDSEIHLYVFSDGNDEYDDFELRDPVTVIPFEVYLKIHENPQYQKVLKIMYNIHFFNTLFILSEQPDSVSYFVHFMNEEMFFELFGQEQKPGVAYVTENTHKTFQLIEETLAKNPEALSKFEPIFSITPNGEELTLYDGTTYPMEIVTQIDPNQTLLSLYGGVTSPGILQDAVILPLEKMQDLPQLITYPLTNFVLKYKNSNWQEDLVPSIVKELNRGIPSEHPHAYFVLSNEYLDLKGTIDSSNFAMSQWMVFSVSVVLLTGIGCVGLMFTLMQRRKQLFAVSIAFGSTRRRIMAENIAEVGIVLLLGGVIGLFCSPLLKGILYYRLEISFAASGVFVMLGCGLGFALGAVALGMLTIRFKNIAQSLKEE
jgi:ABC-type antimicrobial peptide transport system permease subunit